MRHINKIKIALSLISILFLSLTGCYIQASYEPPTHSGEKEKYQIIVNQNYDEVWKRLIQYSASTFFAIDNYEKDSGLLTLSFGSSLPSEFITGGRWKTTGGDDFEGDYVDYAFYNFGARLTGKMNVVISEIDKDKTKVSVHARYVFMVPADKQRRAASWVFDTGSCDTAIGPHPTLGSKPTRTLCPTYKAEKAIIEAVR